MQITLYCDDLRGYFRIFHCVMHIEWVKQKHTQKKQQEENLILFFIVAEFGRTWKKFCFLVYRFMMMTINKVVRYFSISFTRNIQTWISLLFSISLFLSLLDLFAAQFAKASCNLRTLWCGRENLHFGGLNWIYIYMQEYNVTLISSLVSLVSLLLLLLLFSYHSPSSSSSFRFFCMF